MAEKQVLLENHLAKMATQWDTQLAILDLKPIQVKVLKSLQRNWTSLTVFLGDLDIPIHNNVALCIGKYNPQDLQKTLVFSGVSA